MDNFERASVTLLIKGDDLDPSEITALLGSQPTLGVRKGERFLASNGREREASTGMWHRSSGYISPPDVGQQISSLLANLPSDPALWERLHQQFECWMTVGAYFDGWTGGLVLEPAILGLLSERGLAIDLDLYAPAGSP